MNPPDKSKAHGHIEYNFMYGTCAIFWGVFVIAIGFAYLLYMILPFKFLNPEKNKGPL